MLTSKNKKWAILTAAMLLAGTQSQVLFASDYDTHWAKAPIQQWQQAKILGGYEDGSFKPNSPVTRAELAKIISQVLGLTDTQNAKTYQDVNADAWFAKDISKVSSLNLMNDTNIKFRPNDYATREEAAYLLANAYQLTTTSSANTFSDAAQISPWAKEKVSALSQNGFIKGKENNRFDPKGKLTRAETAAMLGNIIPNYINTPGTYEKVKEGNLVVKSRDVILKNITVTGNLYLAQGIGEGDVTLENVTVTGKTYISGGGINSIKINKSVLTNGATILSSHPIRIVSENGKIALVAATKAPIILAGSYSNIEIPAAAQVELRKAAVDTLTVAAAGGTSAALKLDDSSSITFLIAKSALTATGTGKIENMDIQAAGVTTAQRPTKTKIKEGLTASIAGKTLDSTNSDKLEEPIAPAGGGGGGGAAPTTPVSLLQNLSGKVQLSTGEINAQITNNKIVFDLSSLPSNARLSGFTLNTGSTLNVNLNELDSSLATNTTYQFTDMIAGTSTSEIKEKVGNTYSELQINIAKALISGKDDISLEKAREVAKVIGDYSYTGTITDAAGKSENITIEIKLN